MNTRIERFQTLPHPALLGLSKKSAPDAEEKAMRLALLAAKGCDLPLPVLLGKRIIGWVRGRNFPDPAVEWSREKRWCGFNTYDAIVTALTAGSKLTIPFSKTPSSAPVATNWYDDWCVGGCPSAGAVNGTAKTAVAPDITTTGALFHGTAVSPATKHLVSAMYCMSASTPVIVLYDRLLAYDQCPSGTSTVSQAMTNTATMSRYIDAGSGGASGGKIVMAIGPATTQANQTQLSALTYTDDAGNADQVMPASPNIYVVQSAAIGTATLGSRIIAPGIATAPTTTWSWCLPLAAGDVGARLIKDYTMTWATSQTGTWTFAIVRPLCVLPVAAAAQPNLLDMVMQVANLERIVDGACLSFMHLNPAGTTGGTYYGSFDVAWA